MKAYFHMQILDHSFPALFLFSKWVMCKLGLLVCICALGFLSEMELEKSIQSSAKMCLNI